MQPRACAVSNVCARVAAGRRGFGWLGGRGITNVGAKKNSSLANGAGATISTGFLKRFTDYTCLLREI